MDARPPSQPRNKTELVERILQARAALEQLLAGLSEGQLSRPVLDDGWSVKDHLAHLTVWEAGIVAVLQRQPRHAAMGLDRDAFLRGDFDAINALIHDLHANRPLAEVMAEWRDAHRRLLSVLDTLSDADLFRPYSHYQPDEPGQDSGDPILNWILGNSCEHDLEHLEWIRARIGQT